MAIDPEELKKRRAQRKAQRLAARKRLIVRLWIAGAVLVLCGILILCVALRNNNAQQTETPTQPPVAVSTEPTPEETTVPDPTTVVHFAAAGDLNVTAKVVAAGGSDYDYTGVFRDVAWLLADADLSTVNFEGNLCGAPYGSSGSAHQNLMTALSRAGVDMVQLANSYAINRGISGLISTIDGVKMAGIEPVGVFVNQEEFEKKQGFSLFEVQGVRIAVVSFAKGMDGTTLPPGNEECVNVLYKDYDSVYQTVDEDAITEVLNAVNKEEPDLTVALLHWGSEYNDTISKSQKKIVEIMQEKGVDAIIGTHPHYVQQITFDPETGMLVAYSLGDFVGDAARSGSEYSIILDLEITKDHETGETAITGYDYTPIYTVVEGNEPVRVVRILEAMTAYENGHMNAVSAEIYEKMAYALERIEARTKGA